MNVDARKFDVLIPPFSSNLNETGSRQNDKDNLLTWSMLSKSVLHEIRTKSWVTSLAAFRPCFWLQVKLTANAISLLHM